MIATKVSRKDQITYKATQLFRERGYSASSMRDLAQVLGIEAASIYSHVKSKEEILQNICFGVAKDFVKSTEGLEKKYKEPTARLKAFCIAHVLVVLKETGASAVFFNEWKHLSEPWLQKFTVMRDGYENKCRDILIEGIEKGEFDEVDPKMATLTILSSLNWVYHWYRPEGKLSADEIAEQLAHRILFGIHKK